MSPRRTWKVACPRVMVGNPKVRISSRMPNKSFIPEVAFRSYQQKVVQTAKPGRQQFASAGLAAFQGSCPAGSALRGGVRLLLGLLVGRLLLARLRLGF